jgi:hypothetical protein
VAVFTEILVLISDADWSATDTITILGRKCRSNI